MTQSQQMFLVGVLFGIAGWLAIDQRQYGLALFSTLLAHYCMAQSIVGYK